MQQAGTHIHGLTPGRSKSPVLLTLEEYQALTRARVRVPLGEFVFRCRTRPEADKVQLAHELRKMATRGNPLWVRLQHLCTALPGTPAPVFVRPSVSQFELVFQGVETGQSGNYVTATLFLAHHTRLRFVLTS